jgi:acyl dehydratase
VLLGEPGRSERRLPYRVIFRPESGDNPGSIVVATSNVITSVEQLHAHEGSHLGYTGWLAVTQRDVSTFGEVTRDTYWIHTDPERAQDGPFGGTIAHGFFTLSLLVPLASALIEVDLGGVGVNYGLERVRFPAPVPVGGRIRAGATLESVTPFDGGVQIKLVVSGEIEGAEKPCLVAESLIRYYA